MPIVEPVIRPPAEADSFLLQLTTGCSSNNCSFCGAYLNKPFKVKSIDEIASDIKDGARFFPHTRRVFLMDGDAMVLESSKLLTVLELLQKAFPALTRVAAYANDYNINSKSQAELQSLADNRLRLIYMGLESGSQEVLSYCGKRSTVDGMVEGVQKAASVGIKASVIVLLGLGGVRFSTEHVTQTAEALNRMQPRLLSFLSLMVVPGTALATAVEKGAFKELSRIEILREMRDIIAGLELRKTIFRSDHASNFIPLEGRLPHDKGRLLDVLDAALEGGLPLRPEFMRGL